jgi:hypothetical protein
MKFMKLFFIFFLRLFFCFVAAKLILRTLEWDNRAFLIGLTVIFLGNIYWFDFLQYRDRVAWRLRKEKKPHPEPDAAATEIPSPQTPGDD